MSKPKPTLESFKLNFDMAKQVMTTAAVVLTLVLLYLKTSLDNAIAPAPTLRIAVLLLLLSLVLGVVVLGMHVYRSEQSNYATGTGAIKWVAIAQHSSFLIPLAMISFHVIWSG